MSTHESTNAADIEIFYQGDSIFKIPQEKNILAILNICDNVSIGLY